MPFKTRHMALAGAAIATAALPAFAAMAPGVQPIDLTVYDQMPRIGEAQLATDPYCDRPDTLAIVLAEEYAEDVVATEANADGTSFDFWASEEFGTWTVSYTRADGISCVVGSGTGWDAGDNPSGPMREIGIDV